MPWASDRTLNALKVRLVREGVVFCAQSTPPRGETGQCSPPNAVEHDRPTKRSSPPDRQRNQLPGYKVAEPAVISQRVEQAQPVHRPGMRVCRFSAVTIGFDSYELLFVIQFMPSFSCLGMF